MWLRATSIERVARTPAPEEAISSISSKLTRVSWRAFATSRVLVVHEDVKTLGLGAELSAVIMEEKFDALDAPVLRVTYPDTHAPFSHVLEAHNLPNTDKIVEALRKLAAY